MDPIVPQRQTATLFRKAIRIQFENHRERVYRTASNRTDAGKRTASMGCKITGWGKALPQLTVTNNDLAAIVDTTDEWIVERTGIRQRHVATAETTTDLASEAGTQALEQAGLAPEDIDLLICMTITPDAIIPSQACLVKARMRLANAVAFDLNAACSGCIYGIDVASSMMAASMGGIGGCQRNPIKNALVIGVDCLSRIVDWTDRATCVLFGDGAGAAVISWDEEEPGILATYLRNVDDSQLYLACDAVYDLSTLPFPQSGTPTPVAVIVGTQPAEGGEESYRPFISMQGQKVFKFAATVMAEAVETVCQRAGVPLEEAACIVPHQANERIIRFASKKMGVPMERFQVSIEEVGNTSASSVLMALADAFEGQRIRPGDKVILVGFGAGLTYGALMFQA